MPLPTSLRIPPRLDDCLGNSHLAEAVRLSVLAFEPWISDSTKGLFFFPEYTDHGPRHISSVLAWAEALVREEAWPHLAQVDAAVLVLATLLHDSAMHLTADGLLDLLDPERTAHRPLLKPLDEKSWPQLFDDFFAEARRWDQRTLHRILGDRDRRPEEEEDLYRWIRHPDEMRDCHPIFLMVLLRIADYLEIESGRANATLLKLQRLRSPISREEWDAHRAVQDIDVDEDDAESIFVHARPASAGEFLKLRRLFAGLQAELDTSWAVLGEVYSRQGDLAELGLTLRRVRSNLDDPDKFLADQEPSYFPLHAAFDTAGADLLKLLIRPLYGDRPEIGVRELLQNALDAVHELRQHARDRENPEMRSIPLPEQEADVLISIDRDETGQNWLTVSDKGIGMLPGTVRDYFLKAGASFRQSNTWRRSFEADGKSKVLRSGRFGIGALAAFLLGDRIEVTTRHVEARPEDGIHVRSSYLLILSKAGMSSTFPLFQRTLL